LFLETGHDYKQTEGGNKDLQKMGFTR